MIMKNLYLLVLSVVLLQPGAGAQKPDTSYENTYYEQKVTLFRWLPKIKRSIVFLGDSITDIGEWSALWNDSKILNQGISSDNSFGVLARLDAATSLQPQKLFIMIGINDIARNMPDEVILSNYKKIVDLVKAASPQTKIYIQSILPTNGSFTQFARHQKKDAHIRAVNDGLKILAVNSGSTYVDLYSKFLDSNGQLSTAYTNDGLHLTGTGYLLWKKILIDEGYMMKQ